MYYPLKIHQAYDFLLRAPGILGLGYKNAIVMAIMDYDSAKLVQDILPIHTQVYSSLPVGTPRNASDLTYIKLKTVSGEIRVIAFDWIASEPVMITSKTVRVTLSNVAISDIPLINDALIQNGFTNINVEVL